MVPVLRTRTAPQWNIKYIIIIIYIGTQQAVFGTDEPDKN